MKHKHAPVSKLKNSVRKLQTRTFLIVAVVAVVLGGSTAVVAAKPHLRNSVFQKMSVVIPALAPDKPTELTPVKEATNDTTPTTKKESTAQPSKSQNGPLTEAQRTDPSIIKYATSPDPRSTAYSLTPPKPNPASVDIRITHAGQVKPGTLIEYNATKKDGTSYYGGDLIISPSTVYMDRSLPYGSSGITVSVPNGGRADGAPYMPWYDSSGAFFASYDNNAYTGPGSSWTIRIDPTYPTPTAGTYHVHVVVHHDKPDLTAVEYHGFITVVLSNL